MSTQKIAELFDESCEKAKHGWEASLWLSEDDQYGRFVLATTLMHDNASILDIGCAQGDLYSFVKNRYKNISYAGLDCSEKMIAKAREKFPEVKFACSDFKDYEQNPVELVFAIGTFCFKSDEPQYQFLLQQLQKCFVMCKRAVVLTLLCEQAELKFEDSQLFYYDAVKVIEVISKITPFYIVNTASLSCEMLITMYKPVEECLLKTK